MKGFRLKLAAAVVCILAFFAVLGLAGDYDYAEQVVLRMSYNEYDWVKDTLTKQKHGKEPTQREIAHWWEEHHSDYKE